MPSKQLSKFLALFKPGRPYAEVPPSGKGHKPPVKATLQEPPSGEDVMKLDDLMTVYCSGEYDCNGEIKSKPTSPKEK